MSFSERGISTKEGSMVLIAIGFTVKWLGN
jgi:hypothetical protein